MANRDDYNKGKLGVAEVKFWLSEAKSCEERQKKELIQRNNYPFLVNYYEGFEKIDDVYPSVSTQQVLAIINEFFPNTNAKISELMYQNPDIIVEAMHPDMEGNENLMKSALMHLAEKGDMLIENRVALFDMIYAGYCAVEVDHIIESPEADLLKEKKQEKGLIEKVGDKVRQAFGDKEAEEHIEKEFTPKDEVFATEEKTFIRRWSPLNVPLDWRAAVLKERRYNLKKVEMSKAEFDAKYPDFKDKVFPTDNKFDFAQYDDRDHTKRVVLYEFQIKKKNGVYTTLCVTPQHPYCEIDMYDRPYKTSGFNMKIGTLHKYGKLYPVSFAQVNKKCQDEMNHYVKYMMEVAERNITKFVIDGDKVKEDGKEALRSVNVNDLIIVKGNTSGAVAPLQPTQASPENQKLLDVFDDQKKKQWGISQSKLGGKSDANFATDLQIQEAGFQSSQLDIQEGLRMLIKEEMETGRDIIAELWDGEYFFKITGAQKPEWYMPKKVLNPLDDKPMILNALNDQLTGDFNIKIDIASSLRPNKEKRRKDFLDYLNWLFSAPVTAYLQSKGKSVNIEFVEKTAIDYGYDPKSVFEDLAAMGAQVPGQEGQGGGIPPQLAALLKGGAGGPPGAPSVPAVA